jgi:hypothetical protein
VEPSSATAAALSLSSGHRRRGSEGKRSSKAVEEAQGGEVEARAMAVCRADSAKGARIEMLGHTGTSSQYNWQNAITSKRHVYDDIKPEVTPVWIRTRTKERNIKHTQSEKNQHGGSQNGSINVSSVLKKVFSIRNP